MESLIIVSMIAVVGALIWGVVIWWQYILAILAGLFVMIIGGVICAGVCACSRVLAHGDPSDFDAKDYLCLACAAIVTLLVKIKVGFLSWTWPLVAIGVSLAMVVLLKKKTWSILANGFSIFCDILRESFRGIAVVLNILLNDCLWDTLVWSGHKIIQLARWAVLVIRHGGIGKYKQAQKTEQERIKKEVAEREVAERVRLAAMEKARITKLEEDRKRQEAEREERERAERERIEAEEAVRKDKESRRLSELDEAKLKILANQNLSAVGEILKVYNRVESAKIVRIDPTAFNEHDTPHAQIDLMLRVFGVGIPISVVFSAERVVRSVIGDTEVAVSEWSEFVSCLERCLELAQSEYEVFKDIDDDARRKRHHQEDMVLSRRRAQSVDKAEDNKVRKLDVWAELELMALAFRRMQELNRLLAQYGVPSRADFSNVRVNPAYGNSRGLPYAEIDVEITLVDKVVLVLFAFDIGKVIECKIGREVKQADSWGDALQLLCPYLKLVKESTRKVDEAEIARQTALEEDRKRQEAEREERERAERERIEAEEAVRKDKESRRLDEESEMAFRGAAHLFRNRINNVLERYGKRKLDGDAVILDPTADNEFDQPYAKIVFRLKLAGKLFNYEIFLCADQKLIKFSLNSRERDITDSRDLDIVIDHLEKMLSGAHAIGSDYADDDSPHTGFCRIAYLQNFATHLRELATMAGVSHVDLSAIDVTIKKQMDEGSVYCDEALRACSETNAKFQIYETGLKDKETSRPIRAQYWRNDEGMWCGVKFITRGALPAKKDGNEDGRLQCWVGANQSDRHRQEDNGVATIISKIKYAVENGAIDWVHVLYNFKISRPNARIGHRQVDLMLIVRNCILLIELKHYNNPVSGTENGKWVSVDSISGKRIFVKAGNYFVENPYHQVRITREYMAKVLSSNNDTSRELDEYGWMNLISAAVIFSEDLKDGVKDNIIVNTSSFSKWFYNGRVSETAEILRRVIPGEAGIETSDKAVRIIKDVFGLQEADLAQGVPVPRKA